MFVDGFPDLLDSYQTDIEINYVDQGTTTDIEEYLDYPGNRGLVTYFENGVGYRNIYSYNTDEIFYIDGKKSIALDRLLFTRVTYIG